MYNAFQCIFLRYHEASFPIICTDIGQMITALQKVSKYHVPRKESFTLYVKNKDNTQIRDYYKSIVMY
jgi:hypothetical protein